jgi:hypothetical protein
MLEPRKFTNLIFKFFFEHRFLVKKLHHSNASPIVPYSLLKRLAIVVNGLSKLLVMNMNDA